jgi:hypothetical protein
VPTADGEIEFYFFGEDDSQGSAFKYACITCTEEGELVLLMADRSHGVPEAFEFTFERDSMQKAVDAILEFVGTCHAI